MAHSVPFTVAFLPKKRREIPYMAVTHDKRMEGRLILLSLRVQSIVAGKAG